MAGCTGWKPFDVLALRGSVTRTFVSTSSVLLSSACGSLAASLLAPVAYGYGPSTTRYYPLDRGIVVLSLNTDHLIVASIVLAAFAVVRRHSLVPPVASCLLTALATLYFASLIWTPALWGTLPRSGFIPAVGFWLTLLGTALVLVATIRRASEIRRADHIRVASSASV